MPSRMRSRRNDHNTDHLIFGTNGQFVFVGGSVSIGTAPAYTLHVNGSFAASQKYFLIPHPLDPGNKDLVHGTLEGPELAVYYRGESQLDKGQAEVGPPSYFEALVRTEGRTVQLTPLDGWSPLYVEKGVQNGRFRVMTTPSGNPAQRFYWEVKGVRADADAVQPERLRAAGAIPKSPTP